MKVKKQYQRKCLSNIGKEKYIFTNFNNEQKENKSNIFLNKENDPFTILNKGEINLNQNIESPIKKEIIRKKIIKKGTNYIFPYYYFFLDFLFDKLINPQKFFCLRKAYFTVYNFMCQIYDISTHIILLKQFNLLNNIILDKIFEDNGICPIKAYNNKININDSKIVQKLNKDLKNKRSIIFSNNLL